MDNARREKREKKVDNMLKINPDAAQYIGRKGGVVHLFLLQKISAC